MIFAKTALQFEKQKQKEKAKPFYEEILSIHINNRPTKIVIPHYTILTNVRLQLILIKDKNSRKKMLHDTLIIAMQHFMFLQLLYAIDNKNYVFLLKQSGYK